jgi:hypothetical protein
MTSFENFFKDLCSNYVWFQPASMQHEPKTFEDTARKVYMQYVASEHFPPIQEARRHVYNKLVLVPGDRKKVDWVKIAKKELDAKEAAKNPVEPPLTGEARAKKLQEWMDALKNVSVQSSVPRLSYSDIAKEGGWEKPKETPYPTTSIEEAYVRARHLAYIKANYEPRTGAKLPEWISEDEFNIQFDNGIL